MPVRPSLVPARPPRTTESPSRTGLPIQAIYTVADLANAANLSTPRMRRLLRGCNVEMFLAGRQWMVPLDEIQKKVPALWRNLAVLERLRIEAEEWNRRNPRK
jgi:hypothetical protein